MRARVLLLSGTSLVGQNVLAALAGRREGVELIATSSVADEPWLFDFDAAHLVPPTSAGATFEARVLEILARENPHLVVPCRDEDVVFLARLREARRDLGDRVLCGSARAAEAMVDKWESWRFCARRALPFAPCFAGGSEGELESFLARNGLPVIVKPRRGFASRGVYLLFDEHAVREALRDGECLVQRYLADPAPAHRHRAQVAAGRAPLFHSHEVEVLVAQLMIAPDGSLAGQFLGEHVLRGGVCERTRLTDDPGLGDLGQACARAFAAAGWRGPLNVQCVRDPDGVLAITEFNGRFTGGTWDRTLLGYDEVGLAMRLFAGCDPGPAEMPPPGADVVVRQGAKRRLDPAAMRTLLRDGSWRARSTG